MKYKNHLIGALGMIFCVLPLSLQADPVTKTALKRSLQTGPLINMNTHVGRNIEFGLRALEMSVRPARLDIEKVLTHQVVTPKVVPLAYWNSLPQAERPSMSTQLKTPGFLGESFSAGWKNYLQNSKFTQADWGAWLTASFPAGTQFRGYFVRTLWELQTLADQPVVDGVSAQEALQQAFAQANKLQYGFLAIAAGGNERRAKEVLVMNLEENSWISFNKSKGQALAAHFGPLVRLFHGQNLYLSVQLGENKILIRIPEGKTNMVETSVNGLVWKKHTADSAEGKDLLFAIQNELVIGWDKTANKFLFSKEQGSPTFSTPQEVLLLQQAKDKHVPTKIESGHVKVYFPTTKKFENVFYPDAQGNLVCAAGQPVTSKAYDDLSALETVALIQEKLDWQGPQTLLLYDPNAQSPEEVKYLSSDLQYASKDLADIITYEQTHNR